MPNDRPSVFVQATFQQESSRSANGQISAATFRTNSTTPQDLEWESPALALAQPQSKNS